MAARIRLITIAAITVVCVAWTLPCPAGNAPPTRLDLYRAAFLNEYRAVYQRLFPGQSYN